jgi:hypothetical protein
VGFIPIDSVHSPVRKVNYKVEAARLGQITDYDKLALEVWTNGSVTPPDAIGLAAKLLKDHMNIFINFEEEVEAAGVSADSKPEIRNENLNRSVEELELSVRSYNCLKNANIQTIGELVQQDRSRDAEDQEFRPQVAQRDQGNPGFDGLGPGHEDRRARQRRRHRPVDDGRRLATFVRLRGRQPGLLSVCGGRRRGGCRNLPAWPRG